MIHPTIKCYKPGELQWGQCAMCYHTRTDIIINKGVCIHCQETSQDIIEKLIKQFIH